MQQVTLMVPDDNEPNEQIETGNSEDLVFRIYREQAREHRRTILGIVSVLIVVALFVAKLP